METYPSLARSAGNLRVTRCVMSDWGRRAAALSSTARLAPSRAPSPTLADLSAATASSRVAPCAPSEMNAAKAATAATADLVMVMLLPILGLMSGLRPQFYVYFLRARFVVERRAQSCQG